MNIFSSLFIQFIISSSNIISSLLITNVSSEPYPTPPSLKVISYNHQIRSGFNHNCIIYSELDKLHCWGDNFANQLEIPYQLKNQVIMVSLGYAHTCAINNQDFLDCWGDNQQGQVDISDELITHPPEQVSSGANNNCLIDETNTMECWGQNDSNQLDIPSAIKERLIFEVAGGLAHTCAIDVGENVSCWGANNQGQTDTSGKEHLDATKISLGNSHSCATFRINTENFDPVSKKIEQQVELQCWGSSQQGQSDLPAEVKQGAVDVSAGGEHNCALGRQQRVCCWGLNFSGQSRGPERQALWAVAAGSQHSCGLVKNSVMQEIVRCWGSNAKGQTDIPFLGGESQ